MEKVLNESSLVHDFYFCPGLVPNKCGKLGIKSIVWLMSLYVSTPDSHRELVLLTIVVMSMIKSSHKPD